MKYLWGLLLVMLGVGYLGASLGYINYEQISQIWLWWPLILVFIGVDIMTKKLKYGWILMIILTIITGLVIYDVSFSEKSVFGVNRLVTKREVIEENIAVSNEKGFKKAEIEVDAGAVEFDIAGETDSVLNGSLRSNVSKADLNIEESGESVKATISTVNPNRHMPWLAGSIKNKLSLALNKNISNSLLVNSGASRLDFDLSQYIISKLQIKAGASSIRVRLGELVENGAPITIDSGASEIKIEVPKNIGVRVISEGGLTSNTFREFTKTGDNYENDAYKTAEKKIDINLRTGASSVEVSQY